MILRVVGHRLSDLGMIYSKQKRFEAAEENFKRALSILEKAHGADAPELGAVLQNYANMLRDAGRAADAEKIDARLRTLRQR